MNKVLSVEPVKDKIYQVRGKKVMLDKDVAELYEVETKVLMQVVKRNVKRFPGDFMYHPASKELMALRSQIVTSRSVLLENKELMNLMSQIGTSN